ncbi:protein kinase [Streptomyces sp. NPDC006632]|uniref:serine/threonine-protein kinase n=1 Tax=Streptomyces sp. NPDC006632 TaxID=3157182 RepID=UPI0033BC7A0D
MGEVFAGRYELVDPVGRGGAGAVWRAWDRRRRRYVAAKVLQQSDAHTLLRFVREQALRIDHPHVLAPASWAADDDKVLFTMDLVSGGSLAHLIGDYGPLPPRFVCTLLDQLLAGLAAVHAEGVVHRDIKPANVLLEATGGGRPHLRLSDFGISMRKDEPRLTETNYVVGTPGYFAPEQMMGAEPDFPADLFAVGLVALYLLEGSKPDARALVEYFAAHGTPGAPQGVPEPLWQVLAGLLQPNPQNRFRTATGARKALASAVELLPEQDPDEEPVEVFDQIGPLPPGFADHGPERAPRAATEPQATEPGRLRPTDTSGDASGACAQQAFRAGESWPSPAGESWPSPSGPAPETGPGPGAGREPGAGAGLGPGWGPGPDSAPGAASGSGTASGSGLEAASGSGADPGLEAAAGSGAASGSGLGPDSASTRRPGLGPSAVPPEGSGAAAFPPPPPQPPTPPTQAPATRTPPTQAPPTQAPRAQAPRAHGISPQDPSAQAFASHVFPGQAPSPSYLLPPHYEQTPPTPATTPYTTPYPGSYAAPHPPSVPHSVVAPQVPVQGAPLGRPPARRSRPGPPRKVAVPVLLVALVCFAVGFWALTRI